MPPRSNGDDRVLTWTFLPETPFRRRCEELPGVPPRRRRDDTYLTVISGDFIDDAVIDRKRTSVQPPRGRSP